GSIAWSPDNKWLAFGAFGPKALYNVYIVPVTGGEPKQVSFLGNSFGGNITWAKDGKSILFTTAQRTETTYLAKIDLVPQSPRFREDQFRDLFVDNTPALPAEKQAAPKKDSTIESMSEKTPGTNKSNAARIVWEGIRQRLGLIPIGADVNDFILSKDGNTLVITSTLAGQQNIYTWSLDELSREPAVLKQITTTPGRKSDLQFSSDGKEVYFLESGRIQSVSLDSRQTRSIAVTAEMDIDFHKEKTEMFKQAWESQNDGFYDPKFHGKDWAGIRKIYEPYAAGAQTPDELRRLLNLMVGELNASHSGVGGPGTPQFVTGRLGLRFDRTVYENENKYKIAEVVSLSPAALSGEINVGDYLTAIDGKALEGNENLDQLLENKTGKKTTLTISSIATGTNSKQVSLRPVSLNAEKGLLYKQWVQQQKEYVTKASNGRLGYLHMIDMGQGSLDQLYLDMDAENHAKDGVVIDIRNNNGGFVNAYALDVLSRRGYMNMTRRGLPEAPARVQLGQRALDAPTILVTNQHSLSDAEDFSEGYRSLGLGKIVGEPTAGWIIYTSSVGLIDGSTIRLPFIKITDNKGKNMELEPRPVDIPVTNPLGEKGKDRQLDMAVKVLLEQVDAGKKR
ncbi:MAG: PD40 domain-containing protein, partial [Ferruginibacter sp.]|nr:PD40 domain-containing protein [Chitinophagaceae bacterium]